MAASYRKWRFSNREHAFTWQNKAVEFVQAFGLQEQGTYWYLDTRMEEYKDYDWDED